MALSHSTSSPRYSLVSNTPSSKLLTTVRGDISVSDDGDTEGSAGSEGLVFSSDATQSSAEDEDTDGLIMSESEFQEQEEAKWRLRQQGGGAKEAITLNSSDDDAGAAAAAVASHSDR